jgi:acyl-CoA synthetase (AMP-forming)/AMP-acid ligase II
MKSYEKSKIRSLSSIFKTMKSTDICERPIVDPDTVATFILTSGTTGNTENDTYTRN